jgi:hypothetical protein
MNNPCMQRLGVLSMVMTSLAASGLAVADTLHVTHDSDIAITAPTSNFGANGTLFVRNSGTGSARNAFAQFDLSALPAGATVSRATLRIWVSRVEDGGDLDLFAVTEPWIESSLTADNEPAREPDAYTTIAIPLSGAGRFVAVDVTDLVNAWLAGDLENNGIALVPSPATTLRAELNSKENTSASHAPELEVILDGPAGPQGDKGDPGVAGPQGPAGADGAQGPAGPPGADGVDGADGAQGPAGAQGPEGPAGATGPQGPAGAPGLDGAAGADGQSVSGMSLPPGDPNCPHGGSQFESAGGVLTYACNGAPGEVGAAGESVVAMSLDTGDATCPYGGSKFTLGGAETYACNGALGAVGPAGPQGEPGPQGIAGAVGPPGEQGPAGPQGAQGDIGPMGPMGPQGAQGDVGPIGPMGPQGVAGAQGPAGDVGPQGPMGPAGPMGAEGPIGPQGPQGVAGTSGTTGQGAITVYGTATIETAGPAFEPVPGLAAQLDVPENAVVLVHTDGGARSWSSVASGNSIVGIGLFIDGVLVSQRRFGLMSNTGLFETPGTWAISLSTPLAPGLHTFEVKTNRWGGNASADVSGGAQSVHQGQLTVAVLKQ